MKHGTEALHIAIPGLLNRWPVQDQPGFPRPRCAALERLLARATPRSVGTHGPDGTLFALFGLPAGNDSSLPVAAVTRLYDAGEDARNGWWLRVDPVHLRADLHTVRLFEFGSADIDAAEAQSLVAEINTMFGAEGWILDAPSPTRWYLRLEDDPRLQTHSLHEVRGRDLNVFLLSGAEGRRWNGRLTEIQMLLHASPVNADRERSAKASVNGIWPWGGGRLPRGANIASAIFADDALTRGLARLAGVAFSALPKTAVEWREATKGGSGSLVVLNTVRDARSNEDPHLWAEEVEALEAGWMADCLRWLQAGVLDEMSIYVGDGRTFDVAGRGLRRFWRRTRPLVHYLA